MTALPISWLPSSQSNQVFEALTASRWEPSDFEWQDTNGPNSTRLVSKLVHKSPGYFFIFDNARGGGLNGPLGSMIEDFHVNVAAYETRNEPCIPFSEVIDELRAEGKMD